MSLSNGVGGSADPRTYRKSIASEAKPSGVSRAAGGMSGKKDSSPRFTGALDSIGSGIAKLNAGGKTQDVFLDASKEGAAAILPLEGSVILGRSVTSYNRDGWMELQERTFEEGAAAVIWLKGVDWLQSGFKGMQQKVAPRFNHIPSDIAWNKPWGKQMSVDLTPQEMFSRNKGEMNTLLKIKSARWAFSVGLALAGVAYIVPTLNQIKTNMIMTRLTRRKRASEGDNVQFGDPALNSTSPASPQASGQHAQFRGPFPTQLNNRSNFSPFSNSTVQSGVYSNHRSISPFGFSSSMRQGAMWPGQSMRPPFGFPQTGRGNAPQFGGLPGGSLVQGLGHMVEQTPYGSILVVDAGIAGGRSYVASKRSMYETAEVLVRDIGSLYFYIWSVPHIMKALGGGLDSVFKTGMSLEPKIGAEITKYVKENAGGDLSLERVQNLLRGNSTGGSLIPSDWLGNEMRIARSKDFTNLLEKEAALYLNGAGAEALSQARMAVADVLKDAKELNPERIQRLLHSIQQGQAGFAKLPEEQRKNLSIAVKQAFRHSAGVDVKFTKDGLRLLGQSMSSGKDVEKVFNYGLDADKDASIRRMKRMAEVDGLDQAYSKIRRLLNASRDALKGDSKFLTKSETLADLIDTMAKRRLTIDDFIQEELKTAGETLQALKMPEGLRSGLKKLMPEATFGEEGNLKTQLSKLNAEQLNELHTLIDSHKGTKHWWQYKVFSAPARLRNDVLDRVSNVKTLVENGEKQSLTDAARKNLTGWVEQFAEKVPGQNLQALMSEYKHSLKALLSGEQGKLFSMSLSSEDPALRSKLREVTQGGLVNDTAFLRKAQGMVSQFSANSRHFADTGKATKMRESIQQYSDALLKKLEDSGSKALSASAVDDAMKEFVSLSRNLNYGSRVAAMGITMFCLGWVVPHVQTAITKRLTGKDRNPGILSAARSMGYGGEGGDTSKPALSKPQQEQGGRHVEPTSGRQPFSPAQHGYFVNQPAQPSFPRLGQQSYLS